MKKIENSFFYKKILIYFLLIALTISQYVMAQLSIESLLATLQNNFVYIILNCLVLFFVTNLIALATGKWAIGYCVTVPIVYFYSIVNYYVVSFRGMPLTINEFQNAGSAFSVLGAYDINLTSRFYIQTALLFCCAFAIFLLFRIEKGQKRYGKISVITKSVSLLIVGVVSYFSLFGAKPVKPTSTITWQWKEAYTVYGVPLCLLEDTVNRVNPIIKPDNYDESTMQNLTSEYKSDKQQLDQYPDIIFVLNETLFDLDTIVETNADKDPFENINSRQDIVKGNAIVPGVGGGTNSTEYEMLTGNSMLLLPGVTPFNSLDLTKSSSIARQLGSLGYSSFATHPEKGSNYSRTTGYKAIGFDQTKFLEEYVIDNTKDIYRGFPLDSDVYNQALTWYNDMGDGPRFMYVLTLQNHGGYTYVDDALDTVRVQGDFNGHASEMNEFLSSVSLSDKAFCDLIDDLSKQQRPVMVFMVGDHGPIFISDIIDQANTQQQKNIKLRTVPYFVWANFEYDKECFNQTTNIFSLPATILNAIDLPTTAYQKMQIELSNEITALLTTGDYYINEIHSNYLDGKHDIIKKYTTAEYVNLTADKQEYFDFFNLAQ